MKLKKQMKKLALFAGTLSLGIAPQLSAAACSNADLHGAYSFVASGTFGSAAFATAGQSVFDGNGGVTGVIRISLNGTVTPVIAWTGRYSVDPDDCTIAKTADIPGVGTVHFFMTIGAAFRELRFITTDPTTTISGTARRQ
jgi:hypothetical protein